MKSRITIIATVLMALIATTAWARVPRKNPTAIDKGIAAFDKQYYQEAIQWMDQALEQNGDNGVALAYKGSALRRLDRLDEAATALRRATTLIDDVNSTFRAWAHSECFYALIDLGDTIAAMTEINQALRDDARKANYWQNRAAIYSAQGKLDEALSDYDRAIAIDPNDTELREMRERVHQHNERYRAAVAASGGVVAGTGIYAERDTTLADEVMLPQFPGGNQALTAHLNRMTGWDNSKPPVRVLVDVTIDTQGKVKKAAIATGYDKQLDQKALDICRQLPPFAPATSHGKPMECTMTIPLRFVDPNY